MRVVCFRDKTQYLWQLWLFIVLPGCGRHVCSHVTLYVAAVFAMVEGAVSLFFALDMPSPAVVNTETVAAGTLNAQSEMIISSTFASFFQKHHVQHLYITTHLIDCELTVSQHVQQ